MGVIQQFVKDTFVSIIPYLSLGIVVVMLEFYFDQLYMFIDGFLSRPLKRFMQRNFRRTSRVLPHFDSFLTFLLTLLILTPLLIAIINDVLTPFLKSLSNNFIITLMAPIILLVLIYFSFENWYKRRFKRY